MSEMVIIASRGRADGFTLAGFNVIETTLADIKEVTGELTLSGEYGLIVIDDELYNGLGRDALKRYQKTSKSLLMPIELPKGSAEGKFKDTYIEKIIRRSIGYQLKIKK